MKKNQINKAFTLIELIVVITILAILGTIAFIALQGYSAQARDTKRVSDIQNIKKSLDLFSLKTGKYPFPDDYNTVSYSGELIWYQGTVGDVVTTNLSRNLNKKPTDPLSEEEYIYSTINSQTKYELLALYESDLMSFNSIKPFVASAKKGIIFSTNAARTTYPKISGNYDGLYAKTSHFYIPTPSIINGNVWGNIDFLDDEDLIKSQIVDGGDNIPSVSTGNLDITLSVYIGKIKANSSEEEKIGLAEAIQATYSGSQLVNEPRYADVLSKTTDYEKEEFVDVVVLETKEYTNTVINGTCGTDSGGDFIREPANLCSIGNASIVTDNGEGSSYDWTCEGFKGGATATCNANHVILTDGDCSSNNGLDFSIEPPYLCRVGTPSVVIDNGEGSTYNWTCEGINGGITSTCIANHVPSLTTYSGCDEIDMVVGNYIISSCNVGTTIAGTGSLSYGNYYQFGKDDTSWRNGDCVKYRCDWKARGGTDDGSANDWGVYQDNRNSATYSNSDSRSKSLMKGPCASGYHVPTGSEWANIYYHIFGRTYDLDSIANTLKLPYAGYRNYVNGATGGVGTNGDYWASSPRGSYGRYFNMQGQPTIHVAKRSSGLSVRCFKNYY